MAKGLDKTKLITADILGQATAMGVHLNESDAEVRDRLMQEVIENEQAEPTLESPIDVEAIPDEDVDERVARSLEEEGDSKFLQPEIPAELKEELDAPDFDAMAEEELESEGYTGTTYEDASYNMVQSDNEWEELDQDVIEERKKRIAAEKRADYYEKLRMKSETKRWAGEARKYFPLAGSAIDAGHIAAKSRKDYLRQAKKAHETVLPYIKQAIELRDQTLESEKRKVREETREEFIRAWGRATTGPSSYPSRADDYKEELADSRAKGDLARSIGILRKRATAQPEEVE